MQNLPLLRLIGRDTFAYCTGLTSIIVDENNTAYKSIDGNLYSKDGKFIKYAIAKSDTSFTMPKNVTTIEDGAFSGTRLTDITISDSVTYIGNWTFNNSLSLTSITIPDGVISIGAGAFNSCATLTSVTIGKSVTSIGSSAFYGCSNLTSITFNGTVAEWNAIAKDSYWNDNVPATQVVCKDGTVAL